MKDINYSKVFIKGIFLFIIFNLLIAAWQPNIGKLSLYNSIFTGRERLPFGENPKQSYNLSLFDLDAMFASHVIHGTKKTENEFRVIVIGDSSVWGTLLKPEETLSGQLNEMNLSACGKNVKAYNLGYPTISLTKDVMLLEHAMRYKPDLILWMTTLDAFIVENQSSPIVLNNEEKIRDLETNYGLAVGISDFEKKSFWDKTFVGDRRAWADLVRLQIYGVMWSATGIDQFYPDEYESAQIDLEANVLFYGDEPPVLEKKLFHVNALETGIRIAENTPVLIVNEPILISTGENSDIRYNFFYPRWAYDLYRDVVMPYLSQMLGWNYVDLWDIVPANEFTNSAIHLTPAGEKILAESLVPYIVEKCK
ncbi:MAG: hypothetical protein JNK81_00775 [Anaerolineales bacterium]|nr:hypothetical protein [Anaerolineales bacterium]